MRSRRRLSGLSIVLPCHDEEDNLPEALAEARAAARRVAYRHELIVVDDGSSDATRGIALRAAGFFGDVRVIVHEQNRGYGAALRSGFTAARMPWVFVTDADRQFELAEIAAFVPLTEYADVVVGRRSARADPIHRRLAAEAWNALVRALFMVPVHDVDCAFKLIRRDLLDGLELHAGGAMISTELVAKLAGRGARFEQRDVTHRARQAGRQSGGDPRVVARAFGELMRLRASLPADRA